VGLIPALSTASAAHTESKRSQAALSITLTIKHAGRRHCQSTPTVSEQHVAGRRPERKNQRKHRAASPAGPAGATDTGVALEQHRNCCPYQPASRGSHVRGALWQVHQNRFHKGRFRCGRTRARAQRVRGGLNAPAWVLPSAWPIGKCRECLRTPRCRFAEAAGPI
jgi:hypothetical protein